MQQPVPDDTLGAESSTLTSVAVDRLPATLMEGRAARTESVLQCSGFQCRCGAAGRGLCQETAIEFAEAAF